MLSKKNSEALENFSEKLEVGGRSLWQDARRRFMHNRAAVTSLIMLVLIALFVTFAPMVSSFSCFDTGLGHDVQCPGYGIRPLLRNRLLRARPAGARGDRRAYFADGQGSGGAGGGGSSARCTVPLSGYLGGKVDSVMMRLLEILNSFPFMFFVILLVTFFGQNILLIFVAIGMVSWLDMARIVRGQT